MHGIAFVTLSLVVAQAAAHPPFYTLNDDNAETHPPVFTVNEGDEAIEVVSVIKPFEMTNPSRVAGGELYQSDMLLSEDQWEALRTRKAIDNEKMRWTEGSDGYPLVPYIFQDSVNQDDVRAGLDHWMEHTCINFEKTTNTDQPHLQFHIGSGCWSSVGMIYWKRDDNGWYDATNGKYGQQISIGSGCNQLGTVVHEVGHAMGFHHEQSRSDRDNFVTVLLENVQDGKEHNFDKEADNNYGVPYDYSSNMHYGIDYFTENDLPTLVTLDPLAQELIGSRNGLTHRDKLLANKMYNCLGKWLEKCLLSSDPCLNDGYTGKDCTCICPPGTSGLNCENIVGEYYAELRNPLTEKITTEKSITVETPFDSGSKYTKWIVPPKCHTAKLTFTSADLHSSCEHQYFNVRTDSSDMTGQTMCAADVSAGVTLTSDTEIILTMVNYVTYSFKKTLWSADVEFVPQSGCTSPETTTTKPTTTKVITTNTATPTATKPTTTKTITTTTATPTRADDCKKKPKTQTLADGETVTFVNPGSPAYATGANNCGWKFKVGPNADLEISCSVFKLQGKTKKKCKKDYFKIGKEKFCGISGPSGYSKATSKTTTITFKSNKKAKDDIFTCTATAVTKQIPTTTSVPTTPAPTTPAPTTPPPTTPAPITPAPTTPAPSQSCITEGSECSVNVGPETFNVLKTKRSWDGCKADCSSRGLDMAEPIYPQALADYLATNTGGWRYWLGGKGQCTGTPAQCREDKRPFKWESGATIPWSAPWYGSPQTVSKSNAVMLRAYEVGKPPLMALAPHALGYCICQ